MGNVIQRLQPPDPMSDEVINSRFFLYKSRAVLDGVTQLEEDSQLKDSVQLQSDDVEWQNYFEEVCVQELGREEYEIRNKTQRDLFARAAQGGGLFDKLEMVLDKTAYSGLFSVREMASGRRATHSRGLGLAGYAKADPDPALPKTHFFKPGRLFEVRARHSNFPYFDDHTKMGLPSLSMKLGDLETGGSWDLICNSGRSSAFFNADSVWHLVRGLANDNEEDFKQYLLQLPIYMAAQIEGLRILPTSYYHCHYHAHTVFHFTPDDGKRRLARFRIVPADGSPESGRLTREQQLSGEAWGMESRVDKDHPKDYLWTEFKKRLEKGPVVYQIQIQIYEPQGTTRLNSHLYNASVPWSDLQCPWYNLMTLHLTSLMSDDVIELTRFNLGNLPAEINFPHARSSDDFNFVPHLRKAVYESASSSRPKEPDVGSDGVVYAVTVWTGARRGAGTDSDVSISIIGTKTRTVFRQVDRIFIDDFEKGSEATYEIEDIDVGELLCAKIHTKPYGPSHNWFLDQVSISYKSGKKQLTYFLPCYRWLTKQSPSVTLYDGSGQLPHLEKHPYLILQRMLEIQDRQATCRWRQEIPPSLDGFPGYIAAGDDSDQLPRDFRFDDEKQQEIQWNLVVGGNNLVSGKVREAMADAFVKNRDPFDTKQLLLTEVIKRSKTLKYIIAHWREDEEFGRQWLQGINPLKIQRVTELPINFPVTHDMVAGQLEPGTKLQEEIQAGKVYMVNYPELAPFTSNHVGQKRYICAPMCLLYANQGKLLPIAIQLTQHPNPETPIFTKDDDCCHPETFSDWLLAKMWVKVADTQHHQMAEHLMGTHIVMEPIAIATFRNLPSMHPLHKLLLPHTRFTNAINVLGRKVLIPDGQATSKILGLAEVPGRHIEFMRHFYKEHLKFSDMDIPADLEKRGVMNESKLPGYYFRDDALRLWEAIKDFVADMVALFYKSSADVKADMELQAFMEDLRQNGCHQDFGLPDMQTRDNLIHFLTVVIYRMSCGHAAVNFGQLDYYGFSPNAPPYLMKPPPTAKRPTGCTPDDAKKLMPTDDSIASFILVANLLASFSDRERFLGDYPERHFTGQKAQDAIGRFQKNLKKISEDIHKRNKDLPVAYNYLNPDQVPNSIAI